MANNYNNNDRHINDTSMKTTKAIRVVRITMTMTKSITITIVVIIIPTLGGLKRITIFNP